MALPTLPMEGTVVADPELRFTPQGKAVANFRIVANDRKKTDQGWVDGDALFVEVSCWTQQAENVCNSLKKGDRVVVIGKLTLNEWEDKNGQKRQTPRIEAYTVAVSLKYNEVEIKRIRRERAETNPAGYSSGPVAQEVQQDEEPPF